MSHNNDSIVTVEALRTYYEDDSLFSAQPPVKAVDGVSVEISRGETLGLVGESGCGKTTLGRTIVGLESATAGQVSVAGRDVTELSGESRRTWQQRVGMVFQDPTESLNDRMTVGEILQEPLEAHDWPMLSVAVPDADVTVSGPQVTPAADTESPAITIRNVNTDPTVQIRETLPLYPDEVNVTVESSGATPTVSVEILASKTEIRRERAFRLLERVGLAEEHFYRYPHQFSGGQSQRVGIARALALEPAFLVLDEPVSALDVSVQARIINLLEELQDELGLTYLFIAHDLSVVRHIADRVAVMYLGHIVERGPTESLYQNPQHPYTVSLLSAIPGSASPRDGDRVMLEGTPPSPRHPPSGCPFTTRCPAKIRPDRWDLSDQTWRALDNVQAVLYQRSRSSGSVITPIIKRLGIDDTEDITTTVAELLEPHELPPEAQTAVDETTSLAQRGKIDTALKRFTSAFGSICDRDTPETSHQHGTASECHRHKDPYQNVVPTIRDRTDD